MLRFRPDVDKDGNPIMVQCREDEPGEFVKAEHAEKIIDCYKNFAREVADAFHAMGGTEKVWDHIGEVLYDTEIVDTLTERIEDEYKVLIPAEEVWKNLNEKFGLNLGQDNVSGTAEDLFGDDDDK